MGGPYRHFSQNIDVQLYAEDVFPLDPFRPFQLYDLGRYHEVVFVSIFGHLWT